MGCELGQLSRPDLAVLESTPSSCGARVQHTRAGERVTQGAGEGRGEEQEGAGGEDSVPRTSGWNLLGLLIQTRAESGFTNPEPTGPPRPAG